MFTQRNFDPLIIDICQLFMRRTTMFARKLARVQNDLPISIGPITDLACFRSPMPNIKHHSFHPFTEIFHSNGLPKNAALAPTTEFCRIVLEFERQAGFDCTKAHYDLNGRTEDRASFFCPSAMPHCDGGDPLVRVYLLSDEVAPTRFGYKLTEPFHIYFCSGKTRHQAMPASSSYQNLPTIPRNFAHLRVRGGARVFCPTFWG